MLCQCRLAALKVSPYLTVVLLDNWIHLIYFENRILLKPALGARPVLQVSLLIMNRLMCYLVSDNGTCLLQVFSSLFNCWRNTVFAKLEGQFVLSMQQ